MFEPFIARALLSDAPGDVRFDRPVQLSLLPECQAELTFALRLHHATRLHYDLRLRILHTLLSFVLIEPPSLDPDRPVLAKLVPDHDPRYLDSERRIPDGEYEAGPTMPVDLGSFIPRLRTYDTYELEALHQLGKGDLQFTLHGHHLRGDWQLRARRGDHFEFRKLEDAHASRTRVLTLNRSVVTGKTLSEL
ncbi:MAG: DNA polymerase ligase N-terminal domain-containing protein [Fimbriimonas sp.]